MATWTPQHSTVLSLLLDAIVGTQEMIQTRQDYCRILDCSYAAIMKKNRFYTGSKSEGLEMIGSDDDYMLEINIDCNIKVIQSIDENTSTSHYSTFLMSTENVRPGFTLLQHVPHTPLHPFLNKACQNKNGSRYLRSDLLIHNTVTGMQGAIPQTILKNMITIRIQGPS